MVLKETLTSDKGQTARVSRPAGRSVGSEGGARGQRFRVSEAGSTEGADSMEVPKETVAAVGDVGSGRTCKETRS